VTPFNGARFRRADLADSQTESQHNKQQRIIARALNSTAIGAGQKIPGFLRSQRFSRPLFWKRGRRHEIGCCRIVSDDTHRAKIFVERSYYGKLPRNRMRPLFPQKLRQPLSYSPHDFSQSPGAECRDCRTASETIEETCSDTCKSGMIHFVDWCKADRLLIR
jgi:hypothetical protein